jgi:hypothetical protein
MCLGELTAGQSSQLVTVLRHINLVVSLTSSFSGNINIDL